MTARIGPKHREDGSDLILLAVFVHGLWLRVDSAIARVRASEALPVHPAHDLSYRERFAHGLVLAAWWRVHLWAVVVVVINRRGSLPLTRMRRQSD